MELVLPELDVTKRVTWSFHVADLHKKLRYDMIIGQDLLFELKLYLCLFDYTIGGNGGTYEGYTVSTNDPSDLRDDAIFKN